MKGHVAAVVVLMHALSVAAGEFGCPAGTSKYSCCVGHNFSEGNGYPYVENIQTTGVTVGSTEVTVTTACGAIPGDPPTDPRRELRSTSAFNTLLRAMLRIDAVSGANPGARFAVRFLIDGVEVGGATRFIRMKPDSTLPLLPQGDELNATAHNLSAGNHLFEVKARMVDGGTMLVGLSWITAQGVPASHPSGRSVIDASTSITPSWTAVTATLGFTVPEGQAYDIFPQAYFQFQGGTPGDHISVGFGLKHRTDSTYPPSLRNAELSVNCPLKDANGQCYWPTTDSARDGINIQDHLFNVGAGDWDLVLYAINRDGRTTSIAYRQIEFVAFPVDAGVSVGRLKSPDDLTTDFEYLSSPVTVSSEIGSSDQPLYIENNECGPWTKIAVLDVPASPANIDVDWVGEGYIEILGRESGDWIEPDIEIDVEATGMNVANDFGQQVLSIGAGRQAIFFHINAGRWANVDTAPIDGIGNRLTVWIRKRVEVDGQSPGGPTTCVFTQGQFGRTNGRHDASFTVGKRYMAVKLVPLGSCYHHNPVCTPTALYVVQPCRVLDTRTAGLGLPLSSGETRSVQVAGVCGLPQTTEAIAANVTAVTPTASGWLNLYRQDSPPPSTSVVSYRSGKTRATNALVSVSTDGRVSIYNGGGASVHVLVDVTGYFQWVGY
jgi:hypothetical protein